MPSPVNSCAYHRRRSGTHLIGRRKRGLGNWHFRSSTNQTPRYAQPGEQGIEKTIVLQLKILADVGLVGFPECRKINFVVRCFGSKT